MYTKPEIIQIARVQLALDYNCQPADFDRKQTTIVERKRNDGRRIDESEGCFFKLLCMGDQAIINIDPAFIPWCEAELGNRNAAWLLTYPRLRIIDKKLQEYGHQIADIHHYYLPDPEDSPVAAAYPVQWYEHEDIAQFADDDRFGEAFLFDPNRPDVLAVAALDGETIMGMAGASADCDRMWQMGIDVLPAYRRRGIGTALVALLKQEILKRGKIPFYGTVESHFHSQNIAINAGFFPVWAELYSEAVRERAGERG